MAAAAAVALLASGVAAADALIVRMRGERGRQEAGQSKQSRGTVPRACSTRGRASCGSARMRSVDLSLSIVLTPLLKRI